MTPSCPNVLAINPPADVAKIFKAIIVASPIDVIYLACRPAPADIEPCESMSPMPRAIYSDVNVPAAHFRASD